MRRPFRRDGGGAGARQMLAESHQREVPADADGAGAELFPELAGDVRDVFELEFGALGGARDQRDGHPADLPAEFPRDAERLAAARTR